METVVIYNAGKSAAFSGNDRVAPDSIMYPIVSKYVPFHHVEARLSEHQKREWLRGYDAAKDV